MFVTHLSNVDPLEDAMADLRLTGSVLLHESYLPPLSIAVPSEQKLRELLDVDTAARVFAFHFARRDGFTLVTQDEDPITLNANDAVICAGGRAHIMGDGSKAEPMDLGQILTQGCPSQVAHGTENATELVCGVFVLQAAPLNPLLGALPSVLRVATKGRGPMLAGTASMLCAEVDSGSMKSYAAARLLELFFFEALREHQRHADTVTPSWLTGLLDERIANVIRHVHSAPAENWTVARLAQTASISPSRLAARFRERTGESVMGYVSRWRANLACRMLRDTDSNLGDIAEKVGYDSLPAFSRAFKSHMGVSPANWRKAATA